jgi:hypothetical protein
MYVHYNEFNRMEKLSDGSRPDKDYYVLIKEGYVRTYLVYY